MEQRLAPGLRFSQSHFEDAMDAAVRPGVRWLDVGCGHQVLPEWRAAAERDMVGRAGEVVGVDLDFPSIVRHGTIRLRALASLDHLPFADGVFDLVTANMVAEHLAAPEQEFAEVARVLRPGGVFLFHTPNLLAYTTRLARAAPEASKKFFARWIEGREEGDVFPTYYRVNTIPRIREVAAAAGLEPVSIRGVTSSAEFAVIPPLAALELLWIRRLMRPEREGARQTLIATLRRTGPSPDGGRS
jgi:SAM-dependent methyltransferase